MEYSLCTRNRIKKGGIYEMSDTYALFFIFIHFRRSAVSFSEDYSAEADVRENGSDYPAAENEADFDAAVPS